MGCRIEDEGEKPGNFEYCTYRMKKAEALGDLVDVVALWLSPSSGECRHMDSMSLKPPLLDLGPIMIWGNTGQGFR